MAWKQPPNFQPTINEDQLYYDAARTIPGSRASRGEKYPSPFDKISYNYPCYLFSTYLLKERKVLRKKFDHQSLNDSVKGWKMYLPVLKC